MTDNVVDERLEAMELEMVRYVMTLILAVGRNMKLTMTLNLCMMPLNKIAEIKYTYGSLNHPTPTYT